MKRLVIWSTALLILMAFVIGFTRTVGNLRSVAPSLISIVRNDSALVDGKWCYRKICPGRISIAEGRNIILLSGGQLVVDEADQVTAKYPEGYFVGIFNIERGDEPVQHIVIEYPESTPLPLADIMTNFGTPNFIEEISREYPTARLSICYKQSLCVYIDSQVLRDFELRLHPSLQIKVIDFVSEKWLPDRTYRTWKGFTHWPMGK